MLLVVLLVAIVVQGIAANITNVYTAGLSLVNSVPALGRLRATLLVAVAAVGLSALPGLRRPRAEWIMHLGNVAAPLAGVVLADYVLRQARAHRRAGAVRPARPLPLPERRQRRRGRGDRASASASTTRCRRRG